MDEDDAIDAVDNKVVNEVRSTRPLWLSFTEIRPPGIQNMVGHWLLKASLICL